MFEKSEGAAQNLAGRVQEAFGAITGDTSSRIKGRARRVAGGAQYGYGEFLDQLRESAARNPVATVAAAAGVCFVLGAIWARR